MAQDPAEWRNLSPGDLSRELPPHRTADVPAAISRSVAAFPEWAAFSLDERRDALIACRDRLQSRAGDLAALIALETGKPLREAKLELGAVIAKFDLTFADGERHLRDKVVADGPHPASIRRRARGPAAVIAPFNFPIHLGHGAGVAYLLAGNPVLYKPSPLAVNVGAAYAAEMQACLPPGVFEFVPGWSETGRALCLDRSVRAVCFTGSIPVGTALARELSEDYSKSLALELGGKNSAIIWRDADLKLAATSVAEGMCLTTGQRCNATSRVIIHESVIAAFLPLLLAALARFAPGDPLDEATMLGPLISAAAVERYCAVTSATPGEWILPAATPGENPTGQSGHYVTPAVLLATNTRALDASDLARKETFAPVLVIESVADADAAISRHDAWNFGLTASVFSAEREFFEAIGNHLAVGNLYWNLPTTFSPSTLPFGGWGASGNSHPGARGFVRFATDEQAVQWKA